ncbi:fungal pheromone STE3G-protein-coupled receptor [Marasmius fiardii PR-910]|nr:fungal pheromone STE3G-protein-coupled receptor [Marasmius fiardii PR-910]
MAGHPNLTFSIFSSLGFVLMTICLPWNLRAWNTGACCFIIWTAVACLNSFINSIVWERSVENVAPVWCDISSRLIIGTAQLPYPHKQKLRVLSEDLAIGVGIPVLQMILYYIPQGHRFDILEDLGCTPDVYNTWVGYALVSSWPLVIGSIDAFYCALNLITINRKRNADLFISEKGDNSLDKHRYWRLMIVSTVAGLVSISVSSFFLSLDSKFPLHPWISWEDTHAGFSRVDMYPALIWKNSILSGHAYTRWIDVLCAFLFFATFGTSREAIRNYRAAFRTVCSWLRLERKKVIEESSESSSEEYELT